jgi:hypothetical protein
MPKAEGGAELPVLNIAVSTALIQHYPFPLPCAQKSLSCHSLGYYGRRSNPPKVLRANGCLHLRLRP